MYSTEDDFKTVSDVNCQFNSAAKEKFNNITIVTITLTLSIVPLLFLKQEKFDFLFIRLGAIFSLLAAYSVIMIKYIKTIKTVFDRDKINAWLMSYFLILIISTFFSENIQRSIIGQPGRMEGIITIFLYLYLFIIGRTCKIKSNKIFTYTLIGGILVSLYGIMQFYGYYPFHDVILKGFGSRPSSTMGNPNFLGTYLVLIIPISTCLYIFNSKITGLFGYAVSFYCLLCTSTRSAWLGGMFSILCFIIIHKITYNIKKSQIYRYFIIFLVTLLIMVFFNYQTGGKLIKRFLTISDDAKDFLVEQSDDAGARRGFIWKRVVQMIGEKPIFGFGVENLMDPYTERYRDEVEEKYGAESSYTDKAHNEYLNIAVTSGIPSLMIYLYFIILVLKKGWMNLKINTYFIGLYASVSGYLIQAFFNISMPVTAYVFWIFLGLLSTDFASNEGMGA